MSLALVRLGNSNVIVNKNMVSSVYIKNDPSKEVDSTTVVITFLNSKDIELAIPDGVMSENYLQEVISWLR
jgi:hypothetical protein